MGLAHTTCAGPRGSPAVPMLSREVPLHFSLKSRPAAMPHSPSEQVSCRSAAPSPLSGFLVVFVTCWVIWIVSRSQAFFLKKKNSHPPGHKDNLENPRDVQLCKLSSWKASQDFKGCYFCLDRAGVFCVFAFFFFFLVRFLCLVFHKRLWSGVSYVLGTLQVGASLKRHPWAT